MAEGVNEKRVADAQRLQGVWRMVEEVDRRADGTLVSAGPAQGYDGLLIFTGSGYMSSTIMPKARTWRIASASPQDLRETIEAGSAHAGRYELDASTRTVDIENSVSMNPADTGQWDAVHYMFEDDTLILSGSWTSQGEKLSFTISLVRVK